MKNKYDKWTLKAIVAAANGLKYILDDKRVRGKREGVITNG